MAYLVELGAGAAVAGDSVELAANPADWAEVGQVDLLAAEIHPEA